MATDLGSIAELRRFPVKSMLGEDCDRLTITDHGVAGDRVRALVDRANGKLASAKRPTPWRALLGMAARLYGDRVEITLADGRVIDADAPDCAAALSAALGREVTVARARSQEFVLDRADPDQLAERGSESGLDYAEITIGAAAPGGGFVDFAPVHLIARASLARVAEVAGPAEPVRFRANIVVDAPSISPFGENDWIGRRIAIGEAVVLKVIEPTPRCAIPTLAHGALALNPKLTSAIGGLNKAVMTGHGPLACLGAYAVLERAGQITIDDRARLID